MVDALFTSTSSTPLNCASVVANGVQFISMSRDQRQSCRAFTRETQSHRASESLRCARNENAFARKFAHPAKHSPGTALHSSVAQASMLRSSGLTVPD